VATPLLLLPLDGNATYVDTGAGGTASAAGALRYTASTAPGVEAGYVEEGATNWATNPMVSVNTTNWGSANGALARVTSWSYAGPASAQITASSANAEAFHTFTVPASAHTLSAIVRNTSAGTHTFDLRYSGATVPVTALLPLTPGGTIEPGVSLAGGIATIPPGASARIAGQITGTGTSVASRVRMVNAGNGDTFLVGHLGVVSGSVATSPCPEVDAAGTIQSGYTWAGTAHNSTSTRAATTLSVPLTGHLDPVTGMVAMRVAIDTLTSQRLLMVAGVHNVTGTDYLELNVQSNGGARLTAATRDSGGTLHSATVNGPAGAVTTGTEYTVAARWSSTQIGVSVDGGAWTTTARAATPEGAWSGTTLAVGYAPAFGGQVNGRIGPFFTFDDWLVDSETWALVHDPVWAFDQFAPTPVWTPPVVNAVAFATPQDVLSAGYTETRHTVYIGGVMTTVDSYDTQHRAGRMATATLSIPLPVGDHIVPNAEVEIWDGHNNLMGRRFWGRLPAWNKAITSSGNFMTLKPVGWSSLLAYRERFDLVFDGPITLSAIFDSVCSRRRVPSYRADTVLDDTGVIEVSLGNNPYIDEGKVTIPAAQGPLDWLNNEAEPYGYRVYDDDLGTVRLSRISGEASGDPVVNFAESIGLIEASQDYDISDVTNYWEVQGPEYEDDIGRSVPIRAIPAAITSDPLIPVNDGVNYQQYRNGNLTTQQLAEIVRNRLEIDYSTPQEPVRWSSVAIPGLTVGDTVSITSETLDITQNFWVMAVDVTNDEGGLVATYEGWRGGGSPLPAGVDRVVIPIQSSAIHLGDETVSWYSHPAPQHLGEDYEYYWDFTIPKRATAVNVLFRVHGSNSQFIGGINEDISVSKFELWDKGAPDYGEEDARPHASGTLPVLDENYAQRYHYATDDSKWSPGAIALRGFDEEEVNVRLKLISGENSEATAGPMDDFEVKNVEVEIFGTVEPVVIPAEVST
jgi:hypothetical protein